MSREQGASAIFLREAQGFPGAKWRASCNKLRFLDGPQRVHRVQHESSPNSLRAQNVNEWQLIALNLIFDNHMLITRRL